MTSATFQFIGGYDNRHTASTISASDAHKMVKATSIRPTRDLSRKHAIATAEGFGLQLLGNKPWLALLDANGKRIDTAPYKLISYRDVILYCEQIHTQANQNALSTKSNRDIALESAKALELIF